MGENEYLPCGVRFLSSILGKAAGKHPGTPMYRCGPGTLPAGEEERLWSFPLPVIDLLPQPWPLSPDIPRIIITLLESSFPPETQIHYSV